MTRLPESLCLLVCLLGLLPGHSARATPHPAPADSVGVEKRDGKRYVIHHVDQGQTLFGIARRYRTSVASIKAANPDIKDAVQYGQVVRVPLTDLTRKERKAVDKAIGSTEKEKEATTETTKTTDSKPADAPKKTTKKSGTTVSANSGIHVVEPGQTLYSLAVRYGVLQADLRKWNNLSSNNVLIGQALIVSERAYQARQPVGSPKPEPARPTPKPTSPKPTPAKQEKQVSVTPPEKQVSVTERDHTTPPAATSATEEPKVIRAGDTAPLPTHGHRISDIGLAEVIEGNDNSGKYLALHRTAPIGTLAQVRNDVNNQSIWVKVIGRLPDTGVNDRILVKLSARAFAKLSPSDRRFRAEVSYIIP